MTRESQADVRCMTIASMAKPCAFLSHRIHTSGVDGPSVAARPRLLGSAQAWCVRAKSRPRTPDGRRRQAWSLWWRKGTCEGSAISPAASVRQGPPVTKRAIMAPHILIVEDEDCLLDVVRSSLEKAGYVVESLANGDRAAARLQEVIPDLVLLDWVLPGLSGIELCRRLRRSPTTKTLPVIMLTARSDEMDKVCGLEMGADDYVTKPFSVNELLARAAGLLRRRDARLIADTLKVGDIELNRDAMLVLRQGTSVHLGPTDYRLLEFFMLSPGRVFTRRQLLNGVWGGEVYIDERSVDVHIGRLRKALLHGWQSDPIRTVRGAGYSFEAC